jgi:hypothetical protein
VFDDGYVFDGFQLFELILNELPITGGSVGSSIQECVQSICSLFYIILYSLRGLARGSCCHLVLQRATSLGWGPEI